VALLTKVHAATVAELRAVVVAMPPSSAVTLPTYMRKPHGRSNGVLGCAVTLLFGGRRGNPLEVIDVDGNLGCSESRLEAPQVVSLGQAEIIAEPVAGARGFDRVTMEKFVGTCAARTFFVHCAAPVGNSWSSRQINDAGDRFALSPRYPHGALRAQHTGYCGERVLRLLTLPKPAHQPYRLASLLSPSVDGNPVQSVENRDQPASVVRLHDNAAPFCFSGIGPDLARKPF
jgi:hypothetical protein